MIALREELNVISVEENKKLFAQLRNSEIKKQREAQETIVKNNQGLVISIAASMKHLPLPQEDLIAEGNIGLLKAIDKFDSEKGTCFSTYATYWIKETMRRASINKGSVIRIPVHSTRKIQQIEAASEKISQETGKAPSLKELAEETGLSERTISTFKDSNIKVYSFNALDDENGEEALLNRFPSKALSPDELLIQKESGDFFNDLLSSNLDEREIKILTMRLGLNEEKPKSLAVVSSEMGVSGERVRKIQIRSIEKLKSALSKHLEKPLFC